MSAITKYEDSCLICDASAEHKHHCLSGTSARKIADSNELIAPLCGKCHNLFIGARPKGWSCDVHHCPKMERLMKIIGQLVYEKKYLIEKYSLPFTEDEDEAREAFRQLFGKSFL